MGGFRAMFFPTHIDVTAFAQNEQGQTGEHDKSYCNFPHIDP